MEHRLQRLGTNPEINPVLGKPPIDYYQGLGIEYKSENGLGLLQIAVINNAVNWAWLLISIGLAVNAKSLCGKTSIDMLKNSSWTDMRYLLFLNGAEYNNIDFDASALKLGSGNNNYRIVFGCH